MRWCGYMERIDIEWLAKQMRRAVNNRDKARRCSRTRWIDGVSKVLNEKEMVIQQDEIFVKDGKIWRKIRKMNVPHIRSRNIALLYRPLAVFASILKRFCGRERYGELLIMNLIEISWKKLYVSQASCY